jgi:hypothetical protein
MKDRILASLLTLLVFASGFWAGIWVDKRRPVPPPPGPIMGELGLGLRSGHSREPYDRRTLAAEIERIKPQIDEFRSRLDAIYADFDRGIDPILTPDQRKLYGNIIKRRADDRIGVNPSQKDRVLSDGQVLKLGNRPIRSLPFLVIVPMALDALTGSLGLDEVQRGKVGELLRIRRERFLTLVDGMPPPSLALSRLAPLAQQLGGQASASGAATPP